MTLSQEQQKSEREAFFAWANDKGYDTAHNYDTERSRWVFFNPMTAELWVCWQARASMLRPVPEVRREALQQAYDAMFKINGCKVTRFDAQTAIRKLMESSQ